MHQIDALSLMCEFSLLNRVLATLCYMRIAAMRQYMRCVEGHEMPRLRHARTAYVGSTCLTDAASTFQRSTGKIK